MTVIHLLPLAIYGRHVQDLSRKGDRFIGTCPLPGCQERSFHGNLDDFRRELGVAA